jgi:hypothetical protein
VRVPILGTSAECCADRFEFRAQLGLAHAAGSDDLQILLVTVEVGTDPQAGSIGIEK